MENKQKLLSAVSLCRKAGKLVMGFDAVRESVMSGKAWLVLLAADVSDGTAKRMARTCEDITECRRMPLTHKLQESGRVQRAGRKPGQPVQPIPGG